MVSTSNPTISKVKMGIKKKLRVRMNPTNINGMAQYIEKLNNALSGPLVAHVTHGISINVSDTKGMATITANISTKNGGSDLSVVVHFIPFTP